MDKIIISKSKMIVTLNGKPIDLPPQEFNLLYELAINKNKVVEKKVLIDRAWDFGYILPRSIDVHVSKLRRKLGKSLIITVLKKGLKLSENHEYPDGAEDKQGNPIIKYEVIVEDRILSPEEESKKTEDEIIINGTYKTTSKSNRQYVVVQNVAESKMGRLAVVIGEGGCFAMPIKEFKSRFTLK